MSYRVIREFSDAQDNYHVYQVGDEFPRLNTQVSETRLKSLASDKNATHNPVIVLVEQYADANSEPERETEKEPVAERSKRTRKQK